MLALEEHRRYTAVPMFRARLTPTSISLIYVVLGALWILFSDQVIAGMTDDTLVLSRLQTIKGWFYILATGAMLFLLMRLGTRRLAASERQLRDTLIHFPLPTLGIDHEDRIFFINQRFTDTYGYDHHDLPNMDCWWRLAYPDETYREELRHRWSESLARVRANDGFLAPACFKVRAKDGSDRTVEFTAIALVQRTIVVCRDITDQLAIEERLRHSEKMAAIGQLAGGIAHDFNNMLQGILGYAQLLSATATEETFKARADGIESTALRAASLTDKLLTCARKGPGIVSQVAVHAIIDEALGLFERTVDPRIKLHKAYTTDQLLVMADPGLLQNAVLNLLINARDAIVGPGDIRITTSRLSSSPADDRPMVAIAIADTGTGMDDSTKARATEPFFTTKPIGKGTGLGLSAVHGFAAERGGQLSIDSRLGHGTTVTILLPLAETPASQEANATPSDGRALNLLLIDDEAAVRDTTAALLHSLGHQTHAVDGGQEALRWLGTKRRGIDAVLLDLAMPDMDGRQCLARLRTIDANIAIYITTGYADDDTMAELQALGATAFIRKPYTRQQLATALNSA